MTQTRKRAAGNWKMNGFSADLSGVRELAARFPDPDCDILICPPTTLITRMVDAVGDVIRVGGQDCHAAPSGAHTGDISADMLAEAGATYVIVGHSERRADHAETDALVRTKAEAGIAAGLTTIICVGETLDEREAGQTLDIVGRQLNGSVPSGIDGTIAVIAYEPVWAIGTGKVPTLDQIGEVHDFIRNELAARFGADTAGAISLLYGGSVKPTNAEEIFSVPNVDGALVGGASLKAADFGGIIDALERSAG